MEAPELEKRQAQWIGEIWNEPQNVASTFKGSQEQETEAILIKEKEIQQSHQSWKNFQNRERNVFDSQKQETVLIIQLSTTNNIECSNSYDCHIQNRIQTDTTNINRTKKEDEDKEEDNTSVPESISRFETNSDSESNSQNESDNKILEEK